MKRIFHLAAIAGCVAVVGSCNDAVGVKNFTTYSGVLNGANEKPTAVTTTANGTALISISELGHLSYNIGWHGLSGAATGAHIHGPGDANTVAGVLIDFSLVSTNPTAGAVTPTGAAVPAYAAGTAASLFGGGASGTLKLDTTHYTATVTGDSIRVLLQAGLLYVNVHTAANAGGEIRAQIIKQ